MRNSLLFIALFVFGCNPSEKNYSVPSVVLANSELKTSVDSFMEKTISRKSNNNNITIDIETNGDTTAITIINSLPDPDISKINGASNLKGFHIYLTGVELKAYYKFEPEKTHELDKAILDWHNKKIADIKHYEPLVWKLYFANDSLVKSIFFDKKILE